MTMSKEKTDSVLTLTLVFVRDGSRLLLGLKKRGFGAGKWNGFGGKVERGESLEEAARRELLEEAGIGVGQIMPVGRLSFTFETDDYELDVHVFEARTVIGEVRESDEMAPEWFDDDSIPFDVMWIDDRFWLPLLLAGKRFAGSFHFSDHETIAHHSLIVIEGCPVCGQRDCPTGAHAAGSTEKRVAKTCALD